MDYLNLLKYSFKYNYEHIETNTKLEDCSRYVYLCDHIFNFITYDDTMSELFVKKALEVCTAITNKKTFDYIEDKNNYEWFLIMCNMDFFLKKIDWGGSIRGAWWNIYGDKVFEIDSCGFFKNNEQIVEPLKFNERQWELFIQAMQKFVKNV